MPVPPECQQYADASAALRTQADSLILAATDQEPDQKWKTLQAVGILRKQIGEQENLLAGCVAAHADFTLEVAVFDLRGGPGGATPNRIVQVWQISETGTEAQPLEVPVTGDLTRFAARPSPVGQFVGITVRDLSGAQPTPDFQSSPLVELPTLENDPNRTRIEIVLPSALSLSLERFSSLIPSAPISTTINTPAGQVAATVEHADVRINSGGLECSASIKLKHALGEAAGVLSCAIDVGPPASPTPEVPLRINLRAAPSVSVIEASSPMLMAIANSISPTLVGLISGTLIEFLRAATFRAVEKAASASFGLDRLPEGVSVTVRELRVGGHSADELTV